MLWCVRLWRNETSVIDSDSSQSNLVSICLFSFFFTMGDTANRFQTIRVPQLLLCLFWGSCWMYIAVSECWAYPQRHELFVADLINAFGLSNNRFSALFWFSLVGFLSTVQTIFINDGSPEQSDDQYHLRAAETSIMLLLLGIASHTDVIIELWALCCHCRKRIANSLCFLVNDCSMIAKPMSLPY